MSGELLSPEEFDHIAAGLMARIDEGNLSELTQTIIDETLISLDLEDVLIQVEAAKHASDMRKQLAAEGLPLTREVLDQSIIAAAIVGAQKQIQPSVPSWDGHWFGMRIAGIALLVDEVTKQEGVS